MKKYEMLEEIEPELRKIYSEIAEVVAQKTINKMDKSVSNDLTKQLRPFMDLIKQQLIKLENLSKSQAGIAESIPNIYQTVKELKNTISEQIDKQQKSISLLGQNIDNHSQKVFHLITDIDKKLSSELDQVKITTTGQISKAKEDLENILIKVDSIMNSGQEISNSVVKIQKGQKVNRILDIVGIGIGLIIIAGIVVVLLH